MTVHQDASPSVKAGNARVADVLPFGDDSDFMDADRGFIAALSPGVVTAPDGKVLWDNDSYAWRSPAPRRRIRACGDNPGWPPSRACSRSPNGFTKYGVSTCPI